MVVPLDWCFFFFNSFHSIEVNHSCTDTAECVVFGGSPTLCIFAPVCTPAAWALDLGRPEDSVRLSHPPSEGGVRHLQTGESLNPVWSEKTGQQNFQAVYIGCLFTSSHHCKKNIGMASSKFNRRAFLVDNNFFDLLQILIPFSSIIQTEEVVIPKKCLPV